MTDTHDSYLQSDARQEAISAQKELFLRGLPVDTTHDNYHLWYCWDPGAGQFIPAFALQGVPETDEARGLLIEHPFDSPDMAYTFNARGQLVWLGTLEEQTDAERSAS